MQCIVFDISQKKYCINIAKVNGIHEITDFTQVPNSPEVLQGLINLRGKIIPVINLSVKFGYPVSEITQNSRIINVNLGEDIFGILVDGVHQVRRIEDEDMVESPVIIRGSQKEYISKVAKLGETIAIIIDSDKLLSESELDMLSRIAE